MSNINVALSDSASSVEGDAPPSPTPPTSVTDGSAASVNMSSSRRSVRSKSSVDSYNVAKLSDLRHGKRVASVKKDTRSFSGETLVNEASAEQEGSPRRRRRLLEGEVERALQMDWQVGKLADEEQTQPTSPPKVSRSKSTSFEKIVKAAGKITSALGKRSRDPLSSRADNSSQVSLKSIRRQRTGRSIRTALSANDQELGTNAPPSKRPRLLDTIAELTSSVMRSGPVKKQNKTWLTQGLYAGQHAGIKGTLADTKKKPDAQLVERRYMPYPMFSAGTREADFRIPYDVFAPMKRKENPKEWKKLSKNSFTPGAKEVWRTKKMERSMCLCTPPAADSQEEGCGEHCLNRYMLYECDENNCAIGPALCTNRAFADLARRTKKGNVFDIGVEIVKTKECGYGLRANRSFEPYQIIIEYCGEVITQEESDRRMNEIYKDNNVSGLGRSNDRMLTVDRHTT